MAVRLKDIAQDLKISVVTVSKVLRDHPDIGPQTRQRVLQRMKELNYRPNLAARALVTGKTHAVGLIVPDLVHPFFGQVAKALSGVLRRKGYSLIVSSSDEDPALEQEEIDQLLARRVDVLVVASAQRNVERFRQIVEQKTAVVLIDRKIDGLAAHFVGIDDVEAGRLATEHLVQVGCRNLAHIGGPDVSTAAGRAQGYREVLARRNIKELPDTVMMRDHGGDAGDRSGYDAMKRLLEFTPRPDGVFCYNDPTAMGAMKAALEAGLDVPDDVAIVGCGNVAYADFLRIPLTSVDQQSEQIGERAGKLALSVLENPPGRPKKVVLQPRLVERASTQRSRNRKR
jgi:LacI family transcriptional regulator, galactose operon repressor